MASTTLLTVEQYLNARYEEREPEFVHGGLIDRPMPTVMHGWLQVLLAIRLRTVGFPVVEVRMRLAIDIIRIPDVALFIGSLPHKQLPTEPPLVVIEVVSPDERYSELLKKLEDYQTWGVEHIWVVDPELRKFHVYRSSGLLEAKQFELPDLNLRIDADELFAEASQ